MISKHNSCKGMEPKVVDSNLNQEVECREDQVAQVQVECQEALEVCLAQTLNSS